MFSEAEAASACVLFDECEAIFGKRKQNLDPALVRRLRFVIHFPAPDFAQREIIADWHQLVVSDTTPLDDARRTVVIRIQNEAGEDKAAFEVTKAWPCKYDPTDLNAKGNEVSIDTLGLCNEGIKRIQ